MEWMASGAFGIAVVLLFFVRNLRSQVHTLRRELDGLRVDVDRLHGVDAP